MHQVVSVEEKRNFLTWFLQNYILAKRESAWMLSYLRAKDELLERVHFVDEIHTEKRCILISTTCSPEGIPFQFFKKEFYTTELERAFQDIRTNPTEDIYIFLSFANSEKSPQFAAVREVINMEKQYPHTNSWYSLIAEMVLDEAKESFQKQALYHQIDLALDRQDRQQFMQLTKKLTQLLKEDHL